LKTIDELYEELRESFAGTTGIAVRADSAPAARLYAMAAQLNALYHQLEWTREQCFPQTATGEYLDRFAQMRTLTRRPAAAAAGTVRFYKSGESSRAVTVPAGTVCMTAGYVRFVTAAEAVIGAEDSWADVPVEAAEAGAFGNVAAGAVCVLANAPVGVGWCENLAAMEGGSDAEDDETLRARVLATYARLPNGANTAWYESAALGFSGVAAVSVVPRPRGVGSVDVIVASREGVPSTALLTEIGEALRSMREIAVDLRVLAPETESVTVSVRVRAAAGYDGETVRSAVEEAVESWFDGTLLGKGVTRARLGAVIFGVEGVENYELLVPAADVSAQTGVLPVLGSVTVAELEA